MGMAGHTPNYPGKQEVLTQFKDTFQSGKVTRGGCRTRPVRGMAWCGVAWGRGLKGQVEMLGGLLSAFSQRYPTPVLEHFWIRLKGYLVQHPILIMASQTTGRKGWRNTEIRSCFSRFWTNNKSGAL